MGILQSAIRWLKTGGEGPIARQVQQALPKTYSQSSPILNYLKVPQAQAAAPAPTKPPQQRIISDAADQARLREWEAANAARARTTPTDGGGQSQPESQRQQEQGPSDYDRGFDLAEDKRRVAEEAANQRVRRYGEVITPLTGDIESYLRGRPDLNQLFREQLAEQGVPGRESTLRGFEKDVTNLQGQLETVPTEDIQRRKETGMLTAAAERRIRSMEERPIREQLLKTQGAVSSERIGLQRAYDLVDKMLDITREQEKRGLEPLTTRLEAARGEFANEVDALAQRLTGFNQARTDQLSILKQKIANDQALSLQEQKAADELIKQEAAHLLEMERIAARKKGGDFTFDENDTAAKIVEAETRILDGELTAQQFQDEYDFSFETMQKILKDYAVSFRQTSDTH